MNKSMKSSMIWNVASLFILSVSSLAFNTVISKNYGPEGLSVFNQCYAYYIVASQLGVFGLHHALLYFVSDEKDAVKRKRYLMCALEWATIISAAVMVLFLLGSRVLFCFYQNPVIEGVGIVSLALIPFCLNKVLLFYFNARERLRSYAVFQALRYIFILAALIVLSAFKVSQSALMLSFLAGELLLLLLQLFFIKDLGLDGKGPELKEEMKKIRTSLLVYGAKIMPSNLILDLNTRVDIICLGLFVSDDIAIGIYSFAIVFSDGFYQLLMIIRKIYNPKIVQKASLDYKEGFGTLRKEVLKYSRFVVPVLEIVLLGGYMLYCMILGLGEYYGGAVYIFIIVTCQTLIHPAIIFGNSLSLLGYPEKESFVNVLTVLSNAVMNCVLIFFFGVSGAAIATGLSLIVCAVAQEYALRKTKNFRIL